jgi:acetyl esterase/lipase
MHMKFLLSALLLSSSVYAQADRFKRPVFDSVTRHEIRYSDVFNDAEHSADVYEPFGDTASFRPLIIYVHGGSFVSGDKRSTDCVDFCTRFARLGYVAVSVNYRLAGFLQFLQSKDYQMQTVMRVMADIKSAARYFVVDANGNRRYRIDTSLIFGGGYSAGAVAVLHTAYIDSLNEFTPAEQSLLANSVGTLDGDAGHKGVQFRFRALFSYAGALHRSSWINAGEEPVWLSHSRDDGTVSYSCAPGLGLPNVLELCGTGRLITRLNAVQVPADSMMLDGKGHGWPSAGVAGSDFDSSLRAVARFFYPMLQKQAMHSGAIAAKTVFDVYPNPGNGLLQVTAASALPALRVFGADGRLFLEAQPPAGETRYTLDLRDLPRGLVLIQCGNAVRRVVLE